MGFKSKIFGMFYDYGKLQTFTDKIGVIDAMTDKVEQLLAYNKLAQDFDATNMRSSLGRGIVIASAVVFCAALTAGIVLAPASAALYGLAGGTVFYAAFMTSHHAARPFQEVANTLAARQDELEATLDVSEVAASPRLEQVLSIFPSIKQRFADAAMRAIMKDEAQPEPVKRLVIEKLASTAAA